VIFQREKQAPGYVQQLNRHQSSGLTPGANKIEVVVEFEVQSVHDHGALNGGQTPHMKEQTDQIPVMSQPPPEHVPPLQFLQKTTTLILNDKRLAVVGGLQNESTKELARIDRPGIRLLVTEVNGRVGGSD
jgi:hypothetical protein